MTQGCGKLFVCATPIGNLEDITLRALRILREVDLIAAEDTRRTRQLLTHFDIHTPLISYHQHNTASRIPELIQRLKSGENIAVVSDAGTPGISDPGQELIQAAIREDLSVVPIPGPSAVITALVVAGFDTTAFVFAGFLPRGRRGKREALEQIAKEPRTTVAYEAPHRLLDTLELCVELMPERPLALCREMTKVHEEVVRGNPSFLLEYFKENSPRGEFVLVFSAVEETSVPAAVGEPGEELTIEEQVAQLLKEGYDKKTAIKTVARERGVPKREVYSAAINLPAIPTKEH